MRRIFTRNTFPIHVTVLLLLLSFIIAGIRVFQTDDPGTTNEEKPFLVFASPIQEHPNSVRSMEHKSPNDLDPIVEIDSITQRQRRQRQQQRQRRQQRKQPQHRELASVPNSIIWNNDYRNDGYYWITVRIGYWFPYQSRKLIKSSLRDLETRSKVIKFDCIDDTPKTAKTPYIHLVNNHQRKGCWSRLGRTEEAIMDNGQPISLSEERCMNSATIQHEMMHALGFGHEHSRLDRDNYITILWNNINPNSYKEFEKLSFIDSLGTPYDLDSIMHYRPYDHSFNGKKTIIPKNYKSIGSRSTASPTDILQIQLMYQCRSGTRSLDYFRQYPCSQSCQCWERQSGCMGNHSWCKGNLVCTYNVCRLPGATNPGNSGGSGGSEQRKQITKDQTNRIRNGGRYFIVPGVMFDIQATYSPIYVTNLIFNGLGGSSTATDRVDVDIYTKQWTHRRWHSSPWKWTLIGSVTLNDNGTNNAQSFPRNSFAPIFINSWNRQGFYIRVTNCNDFNNSCNKLRSWQESNYSDSKAPYAEDGRAKILNGCILNGKFDNGWNTCKDGIGGTGYSFWGGFEYSLA